MPDNIIELKAFVLLLLDKIAALELTISKLEAENVALKAENAELKARLTANTSCLLRKYKPFSETGSGNSHRAFQRNDR
jgi:regulator of replication initiation timing